VDISERKRAEQERIGLEEQLRQSQKMEAVGGLAGGIAHDLNNLLTPILGYAEMLDMRLPRGDERREDVQQIRRAAERARDLNRQLLAFGRKQMLELNPVDLRLVLTGAEKMLRRTIREDVQIELVIPSPVGIVRADVGQIEMVLMNLAVNAQDAMPRGGVLTIGLQNTVVGEADAAGSPGMAPGPYVLLMASDTGIGMDRETQARVFEPFFTTKAPGRGTGLGLSTVYGIIKQHGGYVKVESRLGRGTTFRIYLPRIADLPETKQAVSPPAEPNKGNGETILLAEDNEMVRNMTCRLLQDWGYTVLAAGTVEQAIEIVDTAAGPIHLLVTDVIMPTMNGNELYQFLRPRRPGLKVLFMSGYASDVIAPHGVMDEGVQFIQKPFSSLALLRKVSQVLEQQ
jgi:nitrogen-specific signal transduction histidine kinase